MRNIPQGQDGLYFGTEAVALKHTIYNDELIPFDAPKDYCFMSRPFRDHILKRFFLLDRIYRQEDPVFQEVLGEVRLGKLSEAAHALLEERKLDADIPDPPSDYVMLFSHKDPVEIYNQQRLVALRGDEGWTYQAKDFVLNNDKELREQLFSLRIPYLSICVSVHG